MWFALLSVATDFKATSFQRTPKRNLSRDGRQLSGEHSGQSKLYLRFDVASYMALKCWFHHELSMKFPVNEANDADQSMTKAWRNDSTWNIDVAQHMYGGFDCWEFTSMDYGILWDSMGNSPRGGISFLMFFIRVYEMNLCLQTNSFRNLRCAYAAYEGISKTYSICCG